MKKIIMLLMALCLVLPAMNAQNNKALNKALKKEYKVKMKQFKKEKWQIYASSRSLEVALLSHYDKLAKGGDNAFEIVGIASKFKSKNIGHQTGINQGNAADKHHQSNQRIGRRQEITDHGGPQPDHADHGGRKRPHQFAGSGIDHQQRR